MPAKRSEGSPLKGGLINQPKKVEQACDLPRVGTRAKLPQPTRTHSDIPKQSAIANIARKQRVMHETSTLFPTRRRGLPFALPGPCPFPWLLQSGELSGSWHPVPNYRRQIIDGPVPFAVLTKQVPPRMLVAQAGAVVSHAGGSAQLRVWDLR